MKKRPEKNKRSAELMISLEEILVRQNRVIISLLAKQVYGEEKIKGIVKKDKKKRPEAYVEGYNACDGSKGVNDLARVIGVTPGTLSPILQDWENKGIVYDIGNSGKPLYVKLVNLE